MVAASVNDQVAFSSVSTQERYEKLYYFDKLYCTDLMRGSYTYREFFKLFIILLYFVPCNWGQPYLTFPPTHYYRKPYVHLHHVLTSAHFFFGSYPIFRRCSFIKTIFLTCHYQHDMSEITISYLDLLHTYPKKTRDRWPKQLTIVVQKTIFI